MLTADSVGADEERQDQAGPTGGELSPLLASGLSFPVCTVPPPCCRAEPGPAACSLLAKGQPMQEPGGLC